MFTSKSISAYCIGKVVEDIVHEASPNKRIAAEVLVEKLDVVVDTLQFGIGEIVVVAT